MHVGVTESFTHIMIMAHVHIDDELEQGKFTTLSCLLIDVSKCCLFGTLSLKDCLAKVKQKSKGPLINNSHAPTPSHFLT